MTPRTAFGQQSVKSELLDPFAVPPLTSRRGRECGRGIVSPRLVATLAEGLLLSPKLTLLEAK